MQRILKGVTSTIRTVFQVDGTPTNPSPNSATVTITRISDGTVLVNSAAATAGTTGEFTFNLTTVHTSLLDALTVSWTSALGTITDVIEIVGGFMFPLGDLKNMKLKGTGASSPLVGDQYSVADIAEARVLAEQAIEDSMGVAFVPRYAKEILSGNGKTQLFLTWPKVTAIRSATIDGIAVPSLATAVIPLDDGTAALRTGFWSTASRGNILIGYEHGYAFCPARVGRAALRLARRWLIEGPVDDRTTSMTNDQGTFSLVTPGRRGERFDLPEVNAVEQIYGYPQGVL